ncbi:hypothetical protein Droror1_Dr00007286 [Drosera rotundifolia]
MTMAVLKQQRHHHSSELVIFSSGDSLFHDVLESQKALFHVQIDQLREIDGGSAAGSLFNHRRPLRPRQHRCTSHADRELPLQISLRSPLPSVENTPSLENSPSMENSPGMEDSSGDDDGRAPG